VDAAGGAVGVGAVVFSEVTGSVGFEIGLAISCIAVRVGGGVEGDIVLLCSEEAQLFAFAIMAPGAADATLCLGAVAPAGIGRSCSGLADMRVNVGIKAGDELGGGAFSHAAEDIVWEPGGGKVGGVALAECTEWFDEGFGLGGVAVVPSAGQDEVSGHGEGCVVAAKVGVLGGRPGLQVRVPGSDVGKVREGIAEKGVGEGGQVG
jgi:hypothetical protein